MGALSMLAHWRKGLPEAYPDLAWKHGGAARSAVLADQDRIGPSTTSADLQRDRWQRVSCADRCCGAVVRLPRDGDWFCIVHRPAVAKGCRWMASRVSANLRLTHDPYLTGSRCRTFSMARYLKGKRFQELMEQRLADAPARDLLQDEAERERLVRECQLEASVLRAS